LSIIALPVNAFVPPCNVIIHTLAGEV